MNVTPITKDNDRKKGVTFTNGDCNNRLLHQSLEKLDNYTGFSVEDMSRFMKIKGKFDSQAKQVRILFQKLVTKHAVHEPQLDKKGQPILTKTGKPAMKPTMVPTGSGMMDFVFHDQGAFNLEYNTMMCLEFKIEAYQLLTKDLFGAGLTPKEIRACAKMVSDIDPDLIEDTEVFEAGPDAEDAPDADELSEAQNASPEAAIPQGVPQHGSRPSDLSAGH